MLEFEVSPVNVGWGQHPNCVQASERIVVQSNLTSTHLCAFFWAVDMGLEKSEVASAFMYKPGDENR